MGANVSARQHGRAVMQRDDIDVLKLGHEQALESG